jgi:alginate O-acetyltransferase complex protein AlgI
MTISDLQNWFFKTFGQITFEQVENWFTFNPKEPILFNTALFLGMFLVFYPIYVPVSYTHLRAHETN